MDATLLPTNWALVSAGRLTPERMRRVRDEGVHVQENRWPDFLGGEPTGLCTLTWRGPRPNVLDPGLFEPGFPRPIFG